MHKSLIELNLACYDIIFSPSDSSCPMDPSDNLTFTRSGQSPGRPLRISLIELNLACDDVIFCPMDLSDHLRDLEFLFPKSNTYLDTFSKVSV